MVESSRRTGYLYTLGRASALARLNILRACSDLLPIHLPEQLVRCWLRCAAPWARRAGGRSKCAGRTEHSAAWPAHPESYTFRADPKHLCGACYRPHARVAQPMLC